MNYTLNQLRVFNKILETRSITKASEELFMTQPAVSIQLKNFQDQFDLPLTELKGRKIHITDFGFEIAEITEKIMEQLQNIHYKTKEYKGVLTGKLKMSSVSTGKYIAPYFLADFLEQNSGIDLLLDVTNKSKVIESLKNKEIELAIVSVLPSNIEVEEEILIENKLYLVTKSHKTNNNKPLIYREQGSATRKEMENYFKNNKYEDRGGIELTSNEAVKQAVIAGIGNSIIPLIGIKNEVLNGSIAIVSKKNLPIVTKWRIIWLKNRKLSPVAEAYIAYVKENKRRILNDHFNWYLDF
jgi:LysR family transcriptional regulator, low CO2-responsive transcriptional regulator